MKRIILVAIALWMLAGCASLQPLTPEEMTIQRVIEVPNTPKSVLYDKSRMWYASAFRSTNAVIQYENKENGTIMGNGNLSDSILMVRHIFRFSITTEVKDNKARITATGQTITTPQTGEVAVQARLWNNFKDQVEDVMNNYAGYIQNASASGKSDSW